MADVTNPNPAGVVAESNAQAANNSSVEQVNNVESVLAKNRELLAELKKVKDEKKAAEEKRLIEKEEYKTIAEQRLVELTSLKDKVLSANRTAAVKSEFSKLGMAPDVMEVAMKLVDMNTISVDMEHNVVTGADSAVKVIKEKLPQLFAAATPGVSHAAPQGSQTTLTMEAWKALPTAEKLKREKEVLEATGFKFKP